MLAATRENSRLVDRSTRHHHRVDVIHHASLRLTIEQSILHQSTEVPGLRRWSVKRVGLIAAAVCREEFGVDLVRLQPRYDEESSFVRVRELSVDSGGLRGIAEGLPHQAGPENDSLGAREASR